MSRQKYYKFINYGIALVWLVNGLFCKVLNLVPRHGQIVAEILGDSYARTFTILIGLAEVVMFLWVLSEFKPRFNAFTQIFIVILMNILELFLVPELLLWGRWNAAFAILFVLVIYTNAFWVRGAYGN